MSPLRGWRIAGQHQFLKWSRKLRCSFNLPYRRCSISIWCLVVGRTEDAIRAGTAQTAPLCRRDYAVNEVSKCVRSSGNCSICSVRPTPRADLQNASARDSRCPSLTRRVTHMTQKSKTDLLWGGGSVSWVRMALLVPSCAFRSNPARVNHFFRLRCLKKW